MHFLSILATFKNEATILREWVEHHLMQGVDHFYLIDNHSEDDYISVLQPYKEVISLFSVKEMQKRVDNYNAVFEQVRNDINWLAVCDITQYWYTKQGTVRDYLSENHTFDVINIQCKRLGDPGIIYQPKQVRTAFTQICGTPFIKSIAKASVIENVQSTQHLLKSGTVAKLDYKNIMVNDYGVMSLEYFFNVKNNRPHPDILDVESSWSDFHLQFNYGIDTTLKDLTQLQVQKIESNGTTI
jgi:hypothetical protein